MHVNNSMSTQGHTVRSYSCLCPQSPPGKAVSVPVSHVCIQGQLEHSQSVLNNFDIPVNSLVAARHAQGPREGLKLVVACFWSNHNEEFETIGLE